MMSRTATCNCGALKAVCHGEPARVSVCHCLACKRRTGSAFSHNVTYRSDQVASEGESRSYQRRADSGRHSTYNFCPSCGSIVFYENEARPGFWSIPGGAFADPLAPEPHVELYAERQSPWVQVRAVKLVRE